MWEAYILRKSDNVRIFNCISDLIGSTPLLRLNNIEKEYGAKAAILAKLEAFNPAGSAKDRIAKSMIEAAEEQGILKKGSVIIEPTSGNTGIGLASVAAAKGYKTIFTMPETMSVERRNLLKAYGAQIVLTPGSEGVSGAINKANELARTIEGCFVPSQFENPANPQAHYCTTGPEILSDTDGKVDFLIAGIGTGGTLSGTGKYLKEHIESIRIIGVEPSGSPVLSQGKSGPHGLQGIGAGFVPKTLDTGIYDEIMTVWETDAYAAGKAIAQKEGFLAGISSGAALHAAILTAQKEENAGKTIVVILTDSGERYLSTPMFD